MRLIGFLFLFFIITSTAFAQQKTVQGIVTDKSSNQRLAKVYIYNTRNDDGLYNNNKGEFSTIAIPGDTLVAALAGYAIDTLVYKGQPALYFQLSPLFIRLHEVKIIGAKPTPRERLDKNLKDYKYALDRGSSKDLLSLNQNGAGLGIDAIYNLLSRKGANARHLQKILERDYREELIDYRFRPDYVGKVLNIHDFELTDFMQQYRPTYEFVLSASDYAFIVFLRNSYANYKRNPRALRLQPLPKVVVEDLTPQKSAEKVN